MPTGFRTIIHIYDMYKGNNTNNIPTRIKIHKMACKGTSIPLSNKSL